MIEFLVQGRVRIKIRVRVGVMFNIRVYHWQLSQEQMSYIRCGLKQSAKTCKKIYVGIQWSYFVSAID